MNGRAKARVARARVAKGPGGQYPDGPRPGGQKGVARDPQGRGQVARGPQCGKRHEPKEQSKSFVLRTYTVGRMGVRELYFD